MLPGDYGRCDQGSVVSGQPAVVSQQGIALDFPDPNGVSSRRPGLIAERSTLGDSPIHAESTPNGNAVKDFRKAFPKVLPPLPHDRRCFRRRLHCGEEGRGEGAGASGVAPSPQPWPGETGFWRLSSL